MVSWYNVISCEGFRGDRREQGARSAEAATTTSSYERGSGNFLGNYAKEASADLMVVQTETDGPREKSAHAHAKTLLMRMCHS